MWERLIDSADRRMTRGWKIVGGVPWPEIATVFILFIASPVVIPAMLTVWTIGYVSERRENKRDGVQNVR